MAETSLRDRQLCCSAAAAGAAGAAAAASLSAHSLDGEVGFTDHLGGAARSKQADIVLDQTLGQVQQARLVVDGQDG